MKHIYLFLLIVFSIQILEAQIITFSDANFKNALVNTNCIDTNNDNIADADADINNDGEIEVSEVDSITFLNISGRSITSFDGLENFTSLTFLDCSSNPSGSLNASVLPNLETLFCSALIAEPFVAVNLNFSGLNNLKNLDCSVNSISSINLSDLNNLEILNCGKNSITDLDITGLNALENLNCEQNNLASLDLTSASSLKFIECDSNQLTTLNVSGLSNLISLDTGVNQLTALDLSSLTSLENLVLKLNELGSFTAPPALSNLKTLDCSNCLLTSIDVSNLINLETLICNSNTIPSLNLNGLTALNYLSCFTNNISALDVNDLTSLTYLNCSTNDLLELNVSSLINMEELIISGNSIPEIDLGNMTNLTTLKCAFNSLSELDVSDLSQLEFIQCQNNQLINLNLNNTPSIFYLECKNNQLADLELTTLTALNQLLCENNMLTELDLRLPNLQYFDCDNNQLNTLLIKNGKNNFNSTFNNNDSLEYICIDEIEQDIIEQRVDDYGYSNCQINTYCSFTPGGEFFTIQGFSRIDSDINGCDINDYNLPNVKLNVTNGSNTVTFIADDSGAYTILVEEGIHMITPVLENPDYFSVVPQSFQVDFPTENSPYIQDFCFIPNGEYNDLEVNIIPITQARPGFDSDYIITYRNKGTTILSGEVNFYFDGSVIDFVLSNPSVNNETSDNLSFNFSDLVPYESREIFIRLNLNNPTETPPLSGGEDLEFTAEITPIVNDETQNDNTAILMQEVVNSFDPNDKTCLEGGFISPDELGGYLHYTIRFENTGTANAINIVIKDDIDITKFDLSTIVPLSSSHNYITRIIDNFQDNYVEFIFQDINLPFDDASNDGYVTFKIKTLESLVVDDVLENDAEIYFDYNFPIVTNNEQTTVQTLSLNDFEDFSEVIIYPNPVENLLYFQSKKGIDKIKIYDLYGKLVQETILNQSLNSSVLMENIKSGLYLVVVQSNAKKQFFKIIKK